MRRLCWLAVMAFCSCSNHASAPRPTRNATSMATPHKGRRSQARTSQSKTSQSKTAPDGNQQESRIKMMCGDSNHGPNEVGGNWVEIDGELVPCPPKKFPINKAMLADDAANLLFFASGMAGDPTLERRAWVQLGLVDKSGKPNSRMSEFIDANAEWEKTHDALISTVNTPEKARAYLRTHLK